MEFCASSTLYGCIWPCTKWLLQWFPKLYFHTLGGSSDDFILLRMILPLFWKNGSLFNNVFIRYFMTIVKYPPCSLQSMCWPHLKYWQTGNFANIYMMLRIWLQMLILVLSSNTLSFQMLPLVAERSQIMPSALYLANGWLARDPISLLIFYHL